MKDALSRRLKRSRYEHSLGVADTAAFLARRFGEDEARARTAGLLHDCAREFPNEAMRAEADARGVSYGAVEASMPLLLHAPLGALLAREKYGAEDEAVLRAIARHTVGGASMTALDKIVYFADMVEPERDSVVYHFGRYGLCRREKGDVTAFSAGFFRSLRNALVYVFVIVFNVTK